MPQDVTLEGFDETVGFAAVGPVGPDDEPADTDPLVCLDDIERDLPWCGDGDLEWPKHRRSRSGLSESIQLSDQLACPVRRGEPAEPSITETERPGKGRLRVTSDNDWRMRILYRGRKL